VRDDIRRFIFENFLFGEPDDSLGDKDSFLEKGVIDSTGILELVAFLEERFGVKIEDEDLEIAANSQVLIQVGKRKFYKVQIER